MVNQVANELTEQVEHVVKEVNTEYYDIQLIDSSLSGSDLTQRFAVYFIFDGQRQSEALYFTHSAKISPFGIEVKGELSFPKEKGIAAEYIKEIGSFNENVVYQLNPYTQNIDLDARLNLGNINYHKTSVKVGELSLKLEGTPENSALVFAFDGVDVSENNESFRLGEVRLETGLLAGKLATTSLAIANGLFKSKYDRGFSFNDLSLKSSTNLNDKTTFEADWSLGGMKIFENHLTLSPVRFAGKFHGFDSEQFRRLYAISGQSNSDAFADVMEEILESGFKASDVSFLVNDSTVNGHFKLAPTNIANVAISERIELIRSAIDYEFSLVLDEDTFNQMNLHPSIRDHYFNLERNGYYYSKLVKGANNLPLLNGVPL
nr:DUF945 family protein [Vibrio europaeus]